jgi:polysaccharide export outer membrane protein
VIFIKGFKDSFASMRGWILVAVAIASVPLAGCGGTPEPVIGATSASLPAGGERLNLRMPTRASEDYRLAPKDTLQISVVGEPELTLESVRVGEDGGFMMPLVGRVQAAGLTQFQIADEIRDRLAASFVRNPYVTVNLVALDSHFVTVDGAVEDPGVFTFQPDTTLLGALALAGGPNRVARLNQIVVFREVEGQQFAARFDANAIRSGHMIDPVLEPSDRVVVGVSGSSQAWQDLLQALPAFALFTRL